MALRNKPSACDSPRMQSRQGVISQQSVGVYWRRRVTFPCGQRAVSPYCSTTALAEGARPPADPEYGLRLGTYRGRHMLPRLHALELVRLAGADPLGLAPTALGVEAILPAGQQRDERLQRPGL